MFDGGLKVTTKWSAIAIFDIDGVVRDVSGSYRRAIADTVEYFTDSAYRPSSLEIDLLKSEGLWNNDWEASQELIYRHFEVRGRSREDISLDYNTLVNFFNSRYRGANPDNWTGYICDEPLLLQPSYLESLTAGGILWGFFSGATRDEALYALSGRLGLVTPLLIAMEDAPGKPNPTGLLAAVEQLEQKHNIENKLPVIYVGDTVADIYTVQNAKTQYPQRNWIGVGILPPHVQETQQRSDAYQKNLKKAGAKIVLNNVQLLRTELIEGLINS